MLNFLDICKDMYILIRRAVGRFLFISFTSMKNVKKKKKNSQDPIKFYPQPKTELIFLDLSQQKAKLEKV